MTHDKTPYAAPVHHVLRKLDGPLVEAALNAWPESVLTALPPGRRRVGGHRHRRQNSTWQSHARGTCRDLLLALSHRLGLTVWQQAVADKTKESPVMADVLRGLLLERRVITVDALLTPRAIAQTLVEGGGNDVMIVKGNQPQLQQDIHRVFQEPLARTEDRSQVRCGSIPQVMAACRNTAIGLLRWAGEPNIAAACRRCAAQPWSAFALSGIIPDN